MSEPITIEKDRLKVPLTLIAAGAIAWSTWVTMQLSDIKATLATIKVQLPRIASNQ